MEGKDLDAVQSLLRKYLERFDLAPRLNKAEIEHWLLNKDNNPEDRVVWSYVVEVSTSYSISTYVVNHITD